MATYRQTVPDPDTAVTRLLPEEFEQAHQLVVDWYDALVNYLEEGVLAEFMNVEFRARTDEDILAMKDLEGESLAAWLEQNGYADVLAEYHTREIIASLVADMCDFIGKALSASEEGNLTFALASIRKPLRDNLFYLEWMLADGPGFVQQFRKGGKAVDVMELGHNRRTDIIETAMSKTYLGDGLGAEFVYSLRYDKDAVYGFEPLWHQAVHLVTTAKQYPTGPNNFNLVFADDEDRLALWERFYPNLVLLLIHAEAVVQSLFGQLAPDIRVGNEWNAARRVAGYMAWAAVLAGPEAGPEWDNNAREYFDELVEFAQARCPYCGDVLRVPADRTQLGLFHADGVVTCERCRELVLLGEPGDAEDIAVDRYGDFTAWADAAGIPDDQRTELMFAAFVAGRETVMEVDTK